MYGDAGSGYQTAFDSGRIPCGSRLAGVDDIYSDYTSLSYYSFQQGQDAPISISNFLNNDEDMTTADGVPLAYDCLEIIDGGGVLTAVTNFPNPPEI